MVANEEQPRTVLRKSVRLQGRQESEKKEGEEDQKRGIGKASKGKPTKGESVSKPEGGTPSLLEKEEQQEEKASMKGEGRYLNDYKALALLYCTYRICLIRHVATIYFIMQFCAASIREQLPIESGVY